MLVALSTITLSSWAFISGRAEQMAAEETLAFGSASSTICENAILKLMPATSAALALICRATYLRKVTYSPASIRPLESTSKDSKMSLSLMTDRGFPPLYSFTMGSTSSTNWLKLIVPSSPLFSMKSMAAPSNHSGDWNERTARSTCSLTFDLRNPSSMLLMAWRRRVKPMSTLSSVTGCGILGRPYSSYGKSTPALSAMAAHISRAA
mmetsp:Transcript_71784/g.126428  ORF Transcript_71784/g.126428 Transcript_71784/m.126428 type:complete len:208 (+) Transcript_71784:559-1182(+)